MTKNIYAQPELYLSQEEFLFFKEEIKKRSGINLSEMKANLVQARLRSRVLQLGLSSFEEYISHLNSVSARDPEWQLFINQLTTNKTEWFREDSHFHYLTNHFLPAWEKLGKSHLNVWCGASSTGEEPYTLALVLHQFFSFKATTFSVLATDIDTSVLQYASNGIYSKGELARIPEELRPHFDRGTGDISEWVRVNQRIRQKIHFETFNLLSETYPWSGHFDLIFLRNVLIYFDEKTIRHVAEQCFKAAAPEAALFISHSESLQNHKTSWSFKKPSIYRKGRGSHW